MSYPLRKRSACLCPARHFQSGAYATPARERLLGLLVWPRVAKALAALVARWAWAGAERWPCAPQSSLHTAWAETRAAP